MHTKIFAAYLPQYHAVPENDAFWGKGFTDWDGVRNAKPCFPGHVQPRVPLDGRYYDLSDWKVIKWQAELARKYRIDGFNIYHYWFQNGHKVLEKPAELLLRHPEIGIRYFFSWDNTSWVRSWSNILGNAWAPEYDRGQGQGKQVLLQLDYGGEKEWKEHFDYMLPFFQDGRYEKIDGKPVFVIMRASDEGTIREMAAYWDRLARRSGFPGLFLISGIRQVHNRNFLDAQFIYEPGASAWGRREMAEDKLRKYLHIRLRNNKAVKYICDYQKVWDRILRTARKHRKDPVYPGGIVAFDDTPRRGENARVIANASPACFEENFGKLYRLCCENGKEILFLTAWNEWGEGAYLEPDTVNGYAYLEAVKRVVGMVDEDV